MYVWNWQLIGQYVPALLWGLAVTIMLTATVVIAGTVLGVILAFASRSRIEIASLAVAAYIALFRALPILVVLIWIYYVVPTLIPWSMSPFTAAALALSLNLAAFVAETVRSGIEAIPATQLESGLALGMSRGQAMRRIILPQAVRTMLPNLLGLYVMEAKNCSLASVIAVNELLHVANTVISDTFRPLEIYTTVALLYLLLLLPLMNLARLADRRFSRGIIPLLSVA